MSWRNIEPNAYAVLNLLSEAESIIVLDTETTGLAKNAKIIQFSAIRYKINADFSLEQIDFFDTYINPDEKLKAKITEITGISQDMIEKCPKEDIIAKDIVAYLSKASIYAAHNAPFDIDKINAMFERIGIEFCLPAPKVIDTLPCARDCFPDLDSYKLQDIVENIDTENQFRYHNSLEDITTYCNNFKSAADINFNLMEDNTIFGGRGYQHQLLIRCDKYTTIEDFKAMLKSKYEAGTPVIIYYKLATPVDLELTSEQKAVQNQKLYTYKNITNIAVSDELASIDVNYKKDPTTEHDELQNQIDEIKQLISTTETSALLLDNLQKDIESEVE